MIVWGLQHFMSLVSHKFLPDKDVQWLLPCSFLYCFPPLLCLFPRSTNRHMRRVGAERTSAGVGGRRWRAGNLSCPLIGKRTRAHVCVCTIYTQIITINTVLAEVQSFSKGPLDQFNCLFDGGGKVMRIHRGGVVSDGWGVGEASGGGVGGSSDTRGHDQPPQDPPERGGGVRKEKWVDRFECGGMEGGCRTWEGNMRRGLGGRWRRGPAPET